MGDVCCAGARDHRREQNDAAELLRLHGTERGATAEKIPGQIGLQSLLPLFEKQVQKRHRAIDSRTTDEIIDPSAGFADGVEGCVDIRLITDVYSMKVDLWQVRGLNVKHVHDCSGAAKSLGDDGSDRAAAAGDHRDAA